MISAINPESMTAEERRIEVANILARGLLAIRFDQLLCEGIIVNQSELARLAHVARPRMTQMMKLLRLAFDIQEAILDLHPITAGSNPVHEKMLRPLCAQRDWRLQRRLRWSILSKAGIMGGQRNIGGVRRSPGVTKIITTHCNKS
jgi:hypothetical protein